MKITIEISDVVKEAFLDNLMLEPSLMEKFESEEILLPIIKSYLNSCIDKEDMDLHASIFIDSISDSWELDSIIKELLNKVG